MRLDGRRRRPQLEKEKERVAQKLDLSGMALDSFPNPPLNLTCITKLDVSNNHLASIPESLTARLLNVEVLDVHSNELRVLPNSIGCLSKLKILNVSGNLLEFLPKSIEDCRALEELIANFNQLTKLPDTMGFELTNLRKLSVNSNKLAFLPCSTSHMTSLRTLDARLNCLRSLPEDLENLINLEVLNVSQNFQYLQSLPYSTGLLLSLTELDISYNRICVLPDSICCLTKLRKFQAEGNPLKCPPMAVVEQGAEAIREYMSAKMNKTFKSSGPTKKSWVGRLVKCGTFSGSMIPRGDENEGFSFEAKEHHSFDGFLSPSYIAMFSPRRLFSPKRVSSPQM